MLRYAIFILAYFLGAIPFAYFAGLLKGIDVRHHGSGNVGTTNAFRLLGVKLGIAVLLGDFMKGALSAGLGYSFFGAWGGIAGGLLAMAGHSWNPFFGFRPSGKGVAAGFGIITVLMPKIMLLAVGLFIVIVWATRYVSLGSIIAAFTVVISVFLFREPLAYRIFGLVGASTVIFLHRSNIKRLLNGTENKFGKKKS
ncbi:acyl-phosphate glycerol-3-phosphate acyltransferase [Desulfosporosinus acidiphilus SJ4]|uniref:Glycerol-3-phosphate acyltransferase n=1 Tax=Desulfosporosinus acidiphilus (strain DSM 22704 / JCM 16185 / SJ4) TaxID=646529 RepID=I4D4T9_DESAJ|nr:glycerol-3-phosphate 1-O-acyltransferase PlsY [Desulfosporosinus acidiphilus]AFM40813.1 acyl-phosphate glycerol-3-phosphate acyltransferase [Desulfosporosinus acidiphilus SJ4]